MRIIGLVGITAIMSLLTGCGTINSQFDCNAPIGVSCKPLSEIHAMVDTGTLQKNGGIGGTHQDNIEMLPIAPQGESNQNWVAKTPLRSGEQVQRIWVAPFEDKDGNYHAASAVYTVVKPSHWITSTP